MSHSPSFNARLAGASVRDYFTSLNLIDDEPASVGSPQRSSSSSSFSRTTAASGDAFDCLSGMLSCLFGNPTNRHEVTVSILDREGRREERDYARNTRAALISGVVLLGLVPTLVQLDKGF